MFHFDIILNTELIFCASVSFPGRVAFFFLLWPYTPKSAHTNLLKITIHFLFNKQFESHSWILKSLLSMHRLLFKSYLHQTTSTRKVGQHVLDVQYFQTSWQGAQRGKWQFNYDWPFLNLIQFLLLPYSSKPLSINKYQCFNQSK